MLKKFLDYRVLDVKKGLSTLPKGFDIVFCSITLLVYLCISFLIVTFSRVLSWQPLDKNFLFPSFLSLIFVLYNAFVEEIVFRGLLLPHKSRNVSIRKCYLSSMFSIVVFVAWHPVTALCFAHPYKHLFLNPAFLAIVIFMAIACSVTYLKSGSIWMPILIHWITVTIWIFGYGG